MEPAKLIMPKPGPGLGGSRAAGSRGRRPGYLGSTEITLPKGATTPKATRYIDLGGGNQAVQSDDGTISFTLGDHHGTGQLAVDAADLSISRRGTTPFGTPRGQTPADWPGTKGFVGGTTDTSTGLTHLGAREYDASTGRFISVDPIMDPAGPQQINGYAYANHSPVTGSDPTGLYCDSCSYNNPDSVWGPGSGPGCTVENCYDKDGKVLYSVRGTNSSQPSGKASTGSGRKSKPVAEPEPIFLAGVRIPTPKEMNYRSGYQDLWNDYQAQVMRWSEGQCRSEPGSDVCAAAHDLGWVKSSGVDLLELIGVRDAIDCAQGSASGCLWTAVGLTPWGKIGKAAKLLKAGKHTDAAKLATCPVRHSFVAGTEIAMADGTHKPIEQVKVGDKVLATDPRTGQTQAREVVATITKDDDKHYTRLTITTPDGEADITATDHHPFWSPNTQAWVNAADLKPGTRLLTADGTPATIGSIRRFRAADRTYDLTVAGVHTYHVVAGESPILVHNCGGRVKSADWHHIFNRHSVSSRHPGNSRFMTDNTSTIRNQVEEALNFGARKSNGLKGGHVHEYDFGKTVGYDRSGKPLTGIRVVVRNKNIVTAFPIKMGSGTP
ncbi:polymorphic toxin-type HINT domain-containing protein [Streptomyces sp. NPDC005791]|uniref:polymorphic toxin-type HINT domain-containing protein n=1 Tax=Streptomyces sp. NPDC005791 TaxID=3364732 RepID=UPI0036A46083